MWQASNIASQQLCYSRTLDCQTKIDRSVQYRNRKMGFGQHKGENKKEIGGVGVDERKAGAQTSKEDRGPRLERKTRRGA